MGQQDATNPFLRSDQRFQATPSNSQQDRSVLKDLLPGITDSQAFDAEYLRSAEFFEFAKESCSFIATPDNLTTVNAKTFSKSLTIKYFIVNFIRSKSKSKILPKPGERGSSFTDFDDLTENMTDAVVVDFAHELRETFPTPYDIDKFIMDYLTNAYAQNRTKKESTSMVAIIARVEVLLRFVYGEGRYNHYKKLRGLRLSKFVEKTNLVNIPNDASKAKLELKENPFVAVYKYQDVLRAEEDSLYENKQ